MNAKSVILAGMLILSGAKVGNAQVATNGASALLQKGLFEEEANRNLEAAIAAYQAVVTQAEKDRQFAATAVFRLGECYRKLGQTNEANVQYRRVLREFSDQTELARLSRQYVGDKAVSENDNAAQVTQLLEQKRIAEQEDKELERIQAMIKDSPDLINTQDGSGSTPLERAVQKRYLRVIKFLLDNKANPDSRTYQGYTPLLRAAESGDAEVVELLLNGKANPDLTGSQEDNGGPLHVAVNRGKKNVIEVLLAHGAKANGQDQSGRTPLHLASAKGYRAIAELLLTKGAEVDARDKAGETPLDSAITAGNRAIVELLLQNKADVNCSAAPGVYFPPLMYAIAANQLQVAKLLIERGADVKLGIQTGSSEACTPLHVAVLQQRTEIVKLLLEKGANPNERLGRLRIPNSMTATVGAGDYSGWTPLYMAASSGFLEEAKLLLQYKADVDAVNASTGMTALMMAANRSNEEMTALLLTNHANPNLQTQTGKTALDFATSGSAAGAVPAMGQFPPPVIGQMGGFGATARVENRPAIVEMLRTAGADENVQRLSTIGVSRAGRQSTVFAKGSNSFNHPTLFELLVAHYCPPTWQQGGSSVFVLNEIPGFSFPDFSNLQVSRLQNGKTNVFKVDIQTALATGDCSKDIVLEWGDVVEIPEAVHNVTERWTGLQTGLFEALKKCVERKVDVSVHGTTYHLTLKPTQYVYRQTYTRLKSGLNFEGNLGVPGYDDENLTTPKTSVPSFWLSDVVRGANVILSTSDLSRVVVKRPGRTGEMVFDLNKPITTNPLLLKDGDVIELPDKK